MGTAYLSMGSNLGDRMDYLRRGVAGLAAAPGVKIREISSIFETTPVGLTDQPDYLNLVVAVETRLEPHELLRTCQAIEAENGRERFVRWGPRTLDIDLLLYDGVRLKTKELEIPHPRMHERAFVLVPLLEVEPEVTLDGEPAKTWLERIEGDEGQEVRYFASTRGWVT